MTSATQRHPVCQIETASRTDVGRQRSDNQDAYGEWSDAAGRTLLAVADGLGGHLGGATASRMAIETFGQVFAEAVGRDPEALLREAFQLANDRVFDAALESDALRGMGTTGVALLLDPTGDETTAWVAHVGDSRAYQLRGSTLHPLTLDHTLRAQLREARGLDTWQLDEIPGADALMRALGPESHVAVEIQPVSVQPGDRFLLCSDGLWGPVRESDMAEILMRHSPGDAADVLIAEANRRGGPDNVTLQVVAIAASSAELPSVAPVQVEAHLHPEGARSGVPVASTVPGWPPGPSVELRARARLRRWAIPAAGTAAVLTAVLIGGLLLKRALAPGPLLHERQDVDANASRLWTQAGSGTRAGLTDLERARSRERAAVGASASLDQARSVFNAFSEALTRCDLAALEPLVTPELQRRIDERCARSGAPERIDPRAASWQVATGGRLRVEYVEQDRDGRRLLRATLLEQEVGEGATGPWRVAEIEPRPEDPPPAE